MNKRNCRLCLQTISISDCQLVDESLLNSLKLNLKICKENVVCIECANCLQVFSNFAPGRAYIKDKTLPLSEFGSGIKLDPAPIETTSNSKSPVETKVKCSFCTNTRGREDLILLQISKENKYLMDILEQYISEMNLKNTKEFLTCATCFEALEGVSSVISKCLEVEEKINKYIELKGTDDKGQIELKDVQRFTFRPIIKLESESCSVYELEGECDKIQEYTAMDESEIKDEKQLSNVELIIKTENDGITSEQSDCDMSNIKLELSDCEGFKEPFNQNKFLNDPLPKDCVKEHLLTNRNPEVKALKCQFCSYETKRKGNLGQHLLVHKNLSELEMFKCEMCSFETKHKRSLRKHLLAHRSPSKMKMFKCEFCSFETSCKSDRNRHFLIHSSPSELKIFRCEMCPYVSKYKSSLKRHLSTHKSLSEMEMFKCEFCPFEAKSKSDCDRHLLIHSSPSEMEIFKCEMCSYLTKYKSSLKRHLSTHKSLSEIEMFKCEFCSFEAKCKSDCDRHLLIHSSSSEMEIFKCEMCPYLTKYKSSLKRHSSTHISLSEIEMFKCELCSYKTIHKYHLKRHLLTHKHPSEIDMFKCESCLYETRQKGTLKRHLLTHISPSEVK